MLTLHYGNEESLKGQTTAAGMLPGLMMAGTKKHDRQALREELDSLGIRIGIGWRRRTAAGAAVAAAAVAAAAAGQLTFSVEAKRDTLPQALKLLGEILREPAFPAEEFETSKLRMASMLSSGRTEPAALARNKLSRTLSPYSKDDVRYVPTLEETIDRAKHVTLDQIKTALRNADRRLARRAGRRRRLRPREHAPAREGNALGLGIEGAVQADRPQGRGQRNRIEGGHRHARQVERGIPRRALVPRSRTATPTTPRSGSATSSSAAARSPRGWATAFARRTGCPTARPRRSPLRPAIRSPR